MEIPACKTFIYRLTVVNRILLGLFRLCCIRSLSRLFFAFAAFTGAGQNPATRTLPR
jgi:hypothetical protein